MEQLKIGTLAAIEQTARAWGQTLLAASTDFDETGR
jgi:hypothetical protein